MCQVLRIQWQAKQTLSSLLEHHFRNLEDQGHLLPLTWKLLLYHTPYLSFIYLSFPRINELICVIILSTAVVVANCYCFVWPIALSFGTCSAPHHVILVELSIKVPGSPAPMIDIWLRVVSIFHSPGSRKCSRIGMWPNCGQPESFCRE